MDEAEGYGKLSYNYQTPLPGYVSKDKRLYQVNVRAFCPNYRMVINTHIYILVEGSEDSGQSRKAAQVDT